jgi:hypothetical protein
LDFTTFVIAGPSTNTLSTALELGGTQIQGAGVVVSPATNCLTDSFSVTGSPGGNPPMICGTNTGYHIMIIKTILAKQFKNESSFFLHL